MTEQLLHCAVEQSVATITMTRPDSLNSFNAALRLKLLEQLQHCAADDTVRVIVLTGEGRAFSAGADLNETHPAGQTVEERLLLEYKPALTAIADSNKPVIAAVNGVAAGIGCAFVQAADLVVMAESACLYQAFSAIGLMPDGGTSWHLVRTLGPKRAYEMMALGEKVPAEECLRLGLVNRVVPADDLMSATHQLAQQLIARAPLSLRYTKEALQAAMNATLDKTIDIEARLQLIANQSEDHAEGKKAFFEKRPPHWLGK